MKYAIISDIHSNVQALKSALDCIDKDNVDEIICLGDIVGYNANPSECIEIIRQHPKIKKVIQGNHDEAITRFANISFSEWREWSKDACDGLKYSHKAIDEKDVEWIKFCTKNQMIVDDPKIPFLISHLSPCGHDSDYGYILDHYAAYRAIQYIQANKIKLAFYGHSHLPTICNTFNKTSKDTHFYIGDHACEKPIEIKDDCYYVINSGAIGQPRNNGVTSYAIFDNDEMLVTIKPFKYNVSEAQNAIMEARYADDHANLKLAKRLGSYTAKYS